MKTFTQIDAEEARSELRDWAEEKAWRKGGRIVATAMYGEAFPGVEPGTEEKCFAAWVLLGEAGFAENIREDCAGGAGFDRRLDMATAAARLGQAIYNGKLPADFSWQLRHVCRMAWTVGVNPLPMFRDITRKFKVNLAGTGHLTCL